VLRRVLAQPGRWPRLLVLVACGVIVTMYWTNEDMAGQPDAVRGTGAYLPILDRGDGHMLYLMARSTAIDFDWRFDNDLARFGDVWQEPRSPVTGRKMIVQPIGPALVWTPLIWVAEAGAWVVDLFGADIPLHGYTLWHQRFVFLSSALFACGAILLGRRLAMRLGIGRWAATYGAISILLGTSLTYYATYMPSYMHAMDAFACAGFLAYWALTLGRLDLGRWVVLGVLLGMATLIRTQELALGVVIVVEVVDATARDLSARSADWRVRMAIYLAGGAIALAVTVMALVPQLLEWHIVFGSATKLPQGPKYTRPGSPMILELLFSARNGWFSTTPLAYSAVLGLLCLPRSVRTIALGLGATVLIQIYLASTIVDWWGGSSFGQRRLCNVTLPLVVGNAALLWRLGRLALRARRVPRWVWHVVAVLGLAVPIGWNLWRVSLLRAGKGAGDSLVPTCCDNLAPPLRGSARWLYDRIGNPFEFPANAWYAWRHGVPLNRWDQAVGNYPLVPPFGAFRDDQIWNQSGGWNIGGASPEYLLDGWSDPFRTDRAARWTLEDRATVLVPNLMPYRQSYTLFVAPGGAHDVTVEWDGDVVATASLQPGWNELHFVLDAVPVGDHEMTIVSTPAPFTVPAGWPAAPASTGVAVWKLAMQILPP
jgi:hypothetical protein